MEEITSLSISGYDREPLRNTFFIPEPASQGLAILFPGQGYSCSMPLLYYPTRYFVAVGVTVLWVEYNYTQKPDFASLTGEERLRWISHDATAAVQAALAFAPFQRITLLGKSLGSFALAHLASHEPAVKNAGYIWLTPLVRNHFVQQAVSEARPHSLFILGDEDPHYDPESLEKLVKATGGQVLLVPRANHSLEIPGDLPASLRAMQTAMDRIKAFWEG